MKNKKGLIFLIVLAIAIFTTAATVVYVSVRNEDKPVKSLGDIGLGEDSEFVSELGDGNYLIRNTNDGSYQIIEANSDGGYEVLREIEKQEELVRSLQGFLGISEVRGDGTPVCGNTILEGTEECEIGQEDLCNYKQETVGAGWVKQKKICRVDVVQNECVCKAYETCGDGKFEPQYEQCDASTPNGNVCVTNEACISCECQKLCGNKIIDQGEECDDGNNANDDGCNSVCKKESCGDKIVNNMEECDDGNKFDGDGCDSQCSKEFCGDGISNLPGEECDDGNTVSNDGCSSECKSEGGGSVPPHLVPYTCGPVKGLVLTGNPSCGGTCPPNYFCRSYSDPIDGPNLCRCEYLNPSCGNWIVEPPEQCDDGNNANGDGCSISCETESHVLSYSSCQSICGDNCPNDFTCYPTPESGGCGCVPTELAVASSLQSQINLENQCSTSSCSCGDGSLCLVNYQLLECLCGDGSNPLYS